MGGESRAEHRCRDRRRCGTRYEYQLGGRVRSSVVNHPIRRRGTYGGICYIVVLRMHSDFTTDLSGSDVRGFSSAPGEARSCSFI